jgi:hypothetical protein
VSYIDSSLLDARNNSNSLSLGSSQPRTFDDLRKTWAKRCEYTDKDEIVKIAVLDTGIDLSHEDFQKARALSFVEGKPKSAKGEKPQIERIIEKKSFCGDENDVQDVDGHGTQVAGIILRLAPRAHLYIARICEGDVNSGVLQKDRKAVDMKSGILNPRPNIVKNVSVGNGHEEVRPKKTC